MPEIKDFLKSLVPRVGLGWTIKVQGTGKEYVHRNWVHERLVQALTEDVRLDFTWEFGVTPEANLGRVRLYNLADSRMDEFKKGGPIRVKAAWQGLQEDTVLIIKGTIGVVEDYSEGELRAFDIVFTDAPEHLHKKISSRSWRPGVQYGTVFKDLNSDLGLSLEKFNPVENGVYRTGMAVFGPCWPQMRMVARDMKSKLYVYNRKVRLMRPDEGIPSQVTLSQVQGLQKIQRRTQLTQDGQAKIELATYEKKPHHRVRTLFEPLLGPDSIFKVVNVAPTTPNPISEGKYRVVRGVHACDSRKYWSEVDAIKIG